MTVYDLTREKLIELKQAYMCELSDVGDYAEVMGVDYDAPSLGELMYADEIIPDELIFEHYNNVCFTEDDFFV